MNNKSINKWDSCKICLKNLKAKFVAILNRLMLQIK